MNVAQLHDNELTNEELASMLVALATDAAKRLNAVGNPPEPDLDSDAFRRFCEWHKSRFPEDDKPAWVGNCNGDYRVDHYFCPIAFAATPDEALRRSCDYQVQGGRMTKAERDVILGASCC